MCVFPKSVDMGEQLWVVIGGRFSFNGQDNYVCKRSVRVTSMLSRIITRRSPLRLIPSMATLINRYSGQERMTALKMEKS